MGRWGGGMFESDIDLDWLGDLSSKVGVDLDPLPAGSLSPEDLESLEKGGRLQKSPEGIRAHLDAGNFTRVFNEYVATSDEWPQLMAPNRYFAVMLAAAAMRVGAKIDESQMEYIRSQYKRCGLYKEGMWQIEQALKHYKSGTPYELANPDRAEADAELEERNRGFVLFLGNRLQLTSYWHSFALMNHMGDQYFEEDTPTMDLTKAMMQSFSKARRPAPAGASEVPKPPVDACAGCKKTKQDVSIPLKHCSKCKMALYCGKECQKAHWKIHKKSCAKLAAARASSAD